MKNLQTEEFITEHMESMKEHGLAMLKDDGEIMGMMEAVTADNEAILIPLLWGSQEEKTGILGMIKLMFQAKNVTHFYMLTEAWMAGAHVDDAEATQALENHVGSLEHAPGRKEVLLVQYTSYDEARMISYEMIRDEDGKFSHLAEPMVMSSKEGDRNAIGGAMIDLLPTPEMFTYDTVH